MSQLSKTERQEISYHYNRGHGPTAIGKMVGRDKSVISRELKRNRVKGLYDGSKAHQKSYNRRYWVQTEPQKIITNERLKKFIETKLYQRNPWSPEQISGYWNTYVSQGKSDTITHATIYKYLYKYRLDLCKRLCSKRQKRKKRGKKSNRVMIPNRIWIDDRPSIVDLKQRLGDWEGDTIVSVKGDKTNIVVLHERKSRYICVSKSKDKTKKRIIPKIKKLLKNKPQNTLTLDNGIEFKGHQSFGIDTYFCHPYSSWQKGAVEYSNRLIRRHFPKKTILKNISPQKLALIVSDINNTPRKSLNWKTPHQVFFSI
jgi:IS30 family transposase